MSFLSRLRHQQAQNTPSDLQLCYALGINASQHIVLTLYLANVSKGGLSGETQTYRVQRQHLVSPPAFLTAADTSILTQLLNQDEHWLLTHQRLLPTADHALPQGSLLEDLIATGKCFTQDSRGLWKLMTWGLSQAITPHWIINACGEQRLGWQPVDTTLGAATLWESHGQRWHCQPETCSLSPTHTSVTAQGLLLAAEQPPLAPTHVEPFLAGLGGQWREQQLPLPTLLPSLRLPAELTPVLTLRAGRSSPGNDGDELCLIFRYTSPQLCWLSLPETPPQPIWSGAELFILLVDDALEQHWHSVLTPFLSLFHKHPSAAIWASAQPQHWRELLLNARPELEALGFYFHIEAEFKHHYMAPKHWQANLQHTDHHWQLALTVEANGRNLDVLELLQQLRAFNQTLEQGVYELPDGGGLLVLPEELLGEIAEELADWLDRGQAGEPRPLNQLYRLDALKDILPSTTQWQGGEALQARALELSSSPVMLDRNSCDIRAELRPYQWLGVCWLQHLTAIGINGLLADDMGLGKTLQTLAHLSLEKKCGRLAQPALLVAPTSLLANWQAEVQRFCPHLSCQIVHGPNRHEGWQTNRHCDLLITSYNLVARDIEHWQGLALSWLILDEAQVIKNPRTQNSQAVRTLRARHRLCLSGTPVENHLGELWSLLDFLEPGVLGTQHEFNQYYQKSLAPPVQARRLQQLLKRIAPFMLRRTKTQVAQDLPPKTIIHQTIVLQEKQQAFYEDLKTQGWEQLNQQLNDTDNSGQQQFLLLTALTRLRQACCDPRILHAPEIPSAKTEFCLNMLQELAAENRAALVFSQFTSVLNILANTLQTLSIPYLMLTGKSQNRAALVEAFQRGEAPIFLISLKAGGVGLNLTRADTVIHFDPWWNAAAEDQATDRAHRIGQTQPVFVYKLIAQNTIEEKIARLQQAKAAISLQVNHNAQQSGDAFALNLENLLALWQAEN